MIIKDGHESLLKLVKYQLNNFFILISHDRELIDSVFDSVLLRVEKNFENNDNKYYRYEGETFFNPFHSAQYCVFLYYLSNTLFNRFGSNSLCDKVYYLNKALNACDLYYEISLPEKFKTDHPVGTVLGRAEYGEGFAFAQHCTVGNNNGIFPRIGKNVMLCANSSILGNCNIGDNVILGAGALVKDEDVPSDSVVFGQSPYLTIKSKRQ